MACAPLIPKLHQYDHKQQNHPEADARCKRFVEQDVCEGSNRAAKAHSHRSILLDSRRRVGTGRGRSAICLSLPNNRSIIKSNPI